MITRFRRGARDERGAIAILVAVLSLVVFGMAALAVDVSMLSMERQKLHDHIDSAAQAGAFELPNGAAAATKANSMATTQDSGLTPTSDLYCIVASTGSPPAVKTSQIPTTCNPGPSPYTVGANYGTTGRPITCNASICAIPCPSTATLRCNTIRVIDSKSVGYTFAPVIGRNSGDTGAVTSVACKGSCGAETPNPMDVVVVADRTVSMSNANRNLMVDAIKSMLLTMDPKMHYVALGAISKSVATASCPTEPGPGPSALTASAIEAGMKVGVWVPTMFSDAYSTGVSGSRVLAASSPITMGLECMKGTSGNAGRGASDSYYGTHLASAMKHAARKLLYPSENNLSSLPARPGTVKKVIIFETDGRPFEVFNGGSTSLSSADDIGAGRQNSGWSAGQNGCKNLVNVANNAKDQNVLVITIGFGEATSANCSDGSTSGTYTRDALARAASAAPDGTPSTASTCDTTDSRTTENSDGDYYFCAATGAEMAEIFKTAISQVTTGIKFVKLP